MCGRIVIVVLSFNVEKCEASLAIAQHEVESSTCLNSFNSELIRRGAEELRQVHGISRNQRHHSRLRSAQRMVQDANGEKGIGADLESGIGLSWLVRFDRH